MKFLNFSTRGIAILPTVLIISGIILSIAIAGGLLASLVSSSTESDRRSVEAFSAAQAGIQDATLKIIRNKCASPLQTGCPSETEPPGADLIDFGNNVTSETWISDRTPLGTGIDKLTILSVGTSRNRKKKIESVVVSDENGDVQVHSFKEVAF